MLSKSNRRKQFLFFFFLVSLKYREIVTVKTVTLYKKLYFFIKSLESKKKKLALTSFYYVSREIWLGNSKKLICIDQSDYSFYQSENVKRNFAHITRDFVICYSCSYGVP